MRITAGYQGKPQVLRDVSLHVDEGEIVGVVGPSGVGKSTISLAILGLIGLKGGTLTGQIRFRGRDLIVLRPRELREIRGKLIALVPQSPISALNPSLKLGAQLQEVWRAHERGARDWKALLESVRLPSDAAFLRKFPRALSVGMAQRFLIAMAIMHRPALIVADEPTSALDTITQSEILQLFTTLNRELGIAILYISHDLASVAALCHRVAILHEGEIVESGLVEQVFDDPRHEYTKKLLAAIPRTAVHTR